MSEKLTKEDFIKRGFTILTEENKPYGNYFSGFMKYGGSYPKLQFWVSNINTNKHTYIFISENHFKGHIHTYLHNVVDLDNLINFFTRERESI